MQKILVSILVLVVSASAFAQNHYTYLTAKKLDSIFDDSALKSSPNSKCIMANDFGEIMNLINVEDFSQDNPFFSDINGGTNEFFDKYCFIGATIDGGSGENFDKIADFILSVKSNDSKANLNWQSALLLGTADFMAQRFKDELVNYAIRQLITNLNDTTIENVHLLFPKTYNYLVNFLKPNQDKGFYYSDLEMLKYHSELDLQDLAFNLPNFIAAIDDEKGNFLKFSTNVLTNSSKFSNPLEIFNELKKVNYNYSRTNELPVPHDGEKIYTNINNIQIEKQLYLLNIFVDALRIEADGSDKIWLDYAKVNPEKIESDLSVRFFYALLYEQTRSLHGFSDSFSKEELIRLTRKAANSFKRIEEQYHHLEDKDSANQVEYISLLSAVFETIDSFNAKGAPQSKQLMNYSLEIQNAISNNKKQYVIPNILLIINELGINYNLLDREVLNTLVMLIDFTSVDTAEGMKNLLTTYALPIGSSSLKRTGKSDISLNGYVGFTAGYETLGSNFDNTFFNLGLTAPIGIAISHRYSEQRTFISSGSIFLGFLDLASLVNNSFDDTVEIESDLNFKQFFVPSLGYYFNVKNSPFSFGLVGSYHIASRALNDNVNMTEELDSFRFNFSALVDIPFFTLKHKN